MGCCFCKNTPSPSPPPPQQSSPMLESETSFLKAPLPPQIEEETVKEVLSETPTPKPSFVPEIEEEKIHTLPSLPEIEEEEEEEEEKKKVPIFVAEEISDLSEICSLSESISTTTITERKQEEEQEEVQQRVNRSPAKVPRKRSFPGEFASRSERGAKSPARRPEQPSPGRRNDNAVKSVSGNEVGQPSHRRIAAINGSRRDKGESSGRRSRSPVTRIGNGSARPGMCRSPSRRGGQSPGRIPMVASENSRRLEETKDENRSANESLENPLVSLECFIFI